MRLQPRRAGPARRSSCVREVWAGTGACEVGRDARKPGTERGPRTRTGVRSAFDQPDFTGAGSLTGLFGREFHPLAFAQELEDRSPHGTAVKEMLDPAFVADEAEPFVDQQPSDRA